MSAAFLNEPGDIMQYETEKQSENAIYLQLEKIAERLADQAEKTVIEVTEKLAPISRGPLVDDASKCVMSDPQESWPPHFSIMRDKLARVHSSLMDIRRLLNGTGL